ncbi:hypothetical protein D3C75_982630 [compost metagenome]
MRLGPHGAEIQGLPQQLVEIMAELPGLIHQLSLRRIQQVADEFGVVGHNFEEEHILIDNRIRQRLQTALVQLGQTISEVIGFSADVIHQKRKIIAARKLAG